MYSKKDIEVSNLLNELKPDYEKADMALLMEGLKRTYKERFLMTTRLYKIHRALNKATITHQPSPVNRCYKTK